MKKKNPTLQQNRKKKLLTHEKHVDIIFFIEKKNNKCIKCIPIRFILEDSSKEDKW